MDYSETLKNPRQVNCKGEQLKAFLTNLIFIRFDLRV